MIKPILEETGVVRVIFTVIGDMHSQKNWSDENRLGTFRGKIDDSNSQLIEDINNNIIQNPDGLLGPDTTELPILLNIGRYQMVGGQDMFAGIVQVDRDAFTRTVDGRLIINEDERSYLNQMFRRIFQDLKIDDNDDFSWLIWIVVPLVEAFDGRFNPIGMGGVSGP